MTATLWAPETLVNTTTTLVQARPSVTVLSDGSYVVVWHCASGSTFDVRGQRFAMDGAPIGGEFVVADAVGHQLMPVVTALTSGQFSVSWLSGGDLMTRRFNADGSTAGLTTLTSLPSDIQQVATATYGAGSDRVVVFSDGEDVWRMAFDSSGVASAVTRVNTSTLSSQVQPDVAALNGGYVVTWSVPDGIVRAKVYDYTGVAVTGDIEVTTSLPGLGSYGSKVTALAGGGFVVTWHGTQNGGSRDIWARTFDAEAEPLGPEVRVNLAITGTQSHSEVVALENGGYMVFWFDAHADVVRGQVMDPSGARQGPPLIVSADGDVLLESGDLSAATLTDGRVVVTWTNYEPAGDGTGDGNIRMVIVDPRNGVIEGGPAPLETLYGGASADQIFGLAGRDVVYAGRGDDSVYGGIGNDALHGEKGDDLLRGGGGNDELIGGIGDDWLLGDAGHDQLVGGLGADTLNGGLGDDDADYGAAAAGVAINLVTKDHAGEASGDVFLSIEVFSLTTHDDRFQGDEAVNHVSGRAGADQLLGGGGNDALGGDDGDDKLWGEAGDDGLAGFQGSDRVYGGDGNDVVSGGDGADFLYGEAGDDLLDGGAGLDHLYGGAGADRFVFSEMGDSGTTPATRDHVKDFNRQQGDKIDLSGMDAVAGGADDAFMLVNAFTGVAGQLVAKQNGAKTLTLLQGDVDGNGQADFSITVMGSTVLQAGDFFL